MIVAPPALTTAEVLSLICREERRRASPPARLLQQPAGVVFSDHREISPTHAPIVCEGEPPCRSTKVTETLAGEPR